MFWTDRKGWRRFREGYWGQTMIYWFFLLVVLPGWCLWYTDTIPPLYRAQMASNEEQVVEDFANREAITADNFRETQLEGFEVLPMLLIGALVLIAAVLFICSIFGLHTTMTLRLPHFAKTPKLTVEQVEAVEKKFGGGTIDKATLLLRSTTARLRKLLALKAAKSTHADPDLGEVVD